MIRSKFKITIFTVIAGLFSLMSCSDDSSTNPVPTSGQTVEKQWELIIGSWYKTEASYEGTIFNDPSITWVEFMEEARLMVHHDHDTLMGGQTTYSFELPTPGLLIITPRDDGGKELYNILSIDQNFLRMRVKSTGITIEFERSPI